MCTPGFFENGLRRSHLSQEGKRSFQVVPHGGAWPNIPMARITNEAVICLRPNKANEGAVRTSSEECCRWISAYMKLSDISVRKYSG